MQTQNLGYPRIGSKRQLKKACERYWSGKISAEELIGTGESIRRKNWQTQKNAGIDYIPSNDFSFYDQMLDMTMSVGAIPDRYKELIEKNTELDLYFAMARGYQKDGYDITAMEMTKWFDTNYHYIVPEFQKNQKFKLLSTKIVDEYLEGKQMGIETKPVILGAVSYLWLGKEKEEGFHRISLLENILPVYKEILEQLIRHGAKWVQIDEPVLVLDLTENEKKAVLQFYQTIKNDFPELNIIVANYFEGLGDNTDLALSLQVEVLHLDLVRNPGQLDVVLNSEKLSSGLKLSIGLVDGRNIWKNDFEASLDIIQKAIDKIGTERLIIAPSCSLLHVPYDLDFEVKLNPEVKQWMSFARQKLDEVVALKELAEGKASGKLEDNRKAWANRRNSSLVNNPEVKERVLAVNEEMSHRKSEFGKRKEIQQSKLNLPLFPTTTIGSFPQTKEVRSWRSQFKKGELNKTQYEVLLKKETERTIRWQEQIDIDVLVHGEFERNDMVEYFGEQLDGFAFTENGWVQSYGSRCVKPPVIYGDISRPHPMTVAWSSYAQSLTQKYVKGMLTGPVTILQWSFVRDDQPLLQTCNQIALAIRDEVVDLEKAGIKIIQIDEPAIREGLPLRKADWQKYLQWAVRAFRIASSGVKDETQIHTHMCYSEFNDIILNIAAMDADVITIECSRSQMELLDAFASFNYPNEIGPGVYDIHSPRVPTEEEMVDLLEKAKDVIPVRQLWVNPDCGLKTRHWEEIEKALIEMVNAAKEMRQRLENQAV